MLFVAVSTPVVKLKITRGAVAFYFPSSPRRRRATMKDGKVAMCPSQISSKGADMVVYDTDTALVERSKGSFESKGSNTGLGAASAGGALIFCSTLVNSIMAPANASLSAMLNLCQDLAWVLALRGSLLLCCSR